MAKTRRASSLPLPYESQRRSLRGSYGKRVSACFPPRPLRTAHLRKFCVLDRKQAGAQEREEVTEGPYPSPFEPCLTRSQGHKYMGTTRGPEVAPGSRSSRATRVFGEGWKGTRINCDYCFGDRDVNTLRLLVGEVKGTLCESWSRKRKKQVERNNCDSWAGRGGEQIVTQSFG